MSRWYGANGCRGCGDLGAGARPDHHDRPPAAETPPPGQVAHPARPRGRGHADDGGRNTRSPPNTPRNETRWWWGAPQVCGQWRRRPQRSWRRCTPRPAPDSRNTPPPSPAAHPAPSKRRGHVEDGGRNTRPPPNTPRKETRSRWGAPRVRVQWRRRPRQPVRCRPPRSPRDRVAPGDTRILPAAPKRPPSTAQVTGPRRRWRWQQGPRTHPRTENMLAVAAAAGPTSAVVAAAANSAPTPRGPSPYPAAHSESTQRRGNAENGGSARRFRSNPPRKGTRSWWGSPRVRGQCRRRPWRTRRRPPKRPPPNSRNPPPAPSSPPSTSHTTVPRRRRRRQQAHHRQPTAKRNTLVVGGATGWGPVLAAAAVNWAPLPAQSPRRYPNAPRRT